MGILPVLGDGRQELSLVYAEDLADALLAAAAAPGALGRVYHAAHPEVVTQEQLGWAVGRAVRHRVVPLHIADEWVPALLRLSGRAARLFGRTTLLDADKVPEFLAAAWTCSSHALARDAGWQARTGLDQGLAATARWYAAEGWL
jgi:nucleoside-diphosphate-sugar epimerase